MAMWWLDLVRYADSVGYHGDPPVSVYPFRDYVIRAFNDEQAVRPIHDRAIGRRPAAGRYVRDQGIASGYNRLGHDEPGRGRAA